MSWNYLAGQSAQTAPQRRFMPNLPIRHPQQYVIRLGNSKFGTSEKNLPVTRCFRFLRHLICRWSELRAFRSSRDCTESKDDHGQYDDREASEHGITVRADQHLSATKNQSSEC
jgi:hypothetical protein